MRVVVRTVLGMYCSVIALSPCSAARTSRPVSGYGFICTSAEGEVRRFNIDLNRLRFDDGGGLREITSVSETSVTLVGANPYLMDTPIGPIFHTLELDRKTLILTDQTLAPNRNVNRVARYQCVMGDLIDFSTGNKF